MHSKALVAPVLTYLFHKLEARFDGKPTFLILDEAWVFLDDPMFADRIREWLKVLRKKNVSVIFATQSLADIANSPIAPAIIESCLSRIFLPNNRAMEPQQKEAYDRSIAFLICNLVRLHSPFARRVQRKTKPKLTAFLSWAATIILRPIGYVSKGWNGRQI